MFFRPMPRRLKAITAMSVYSICVVGTWRRLRQSAGCLLENGYGKAMEVDGGIDFEPLLNKMKPKEIKMFYTASELLRNLRP